MLWLERFGRRLRTLFHKRSLEREMDEEMRLHLKFEAEDRILSGVHPEEARFAAQRRFGSVERFKEEGRDAWGVRWVEDLIADARYALRSLRRSPVFAAIAVFTLALGIGANTAVFSVLDGVLLRPLPYPHADDLYAVWEKSDQGAARLASYPTFHDWRHQSQSNVFQGLSYIRGFAVFLQGDQGRERLEGALVSDGFFTTLGVQALFGRTFSPEEERPGGNRVAVLTYDLWQRRFGGDPRALGIPLDVGRGVFTIVGVLPKGVHYPDWAELYLPLASMIGSDSGLSQRGLHVDSRVVARLEPGVPVTRAQQELAGIARQLATSYPKENAGWTDVSMLPLRDAVLGFGKNWKATLLILQVAVGFVLLIACANVANLTLARAAGRSRELAVRAALGASRGRLVRQLLTESLIVALLGGLVGAILATWGVRVIRATPPEGLPRVEEIGVNLPVLAVTMGISLLTAIVVGLTPAIRAATPNILPSLKQGEGRAGTSPSRSRLRSALVVGQVALALVLLVGAGLLLRSFERLSHLNPGFNPTNVVTLDVFPPGQKYQDAASASRLYQRLEEAVAPLPGVQTVALSNHVPLSGAYYPSRVELPGRPPVAGEDESVLFRTISPTYFTAMQIPVVKGRPFAESDMTSTASIAIVNQAFVRKYWPTADPIGQPMTLFKSAQGRPDFGQPFGVTVVGVVGDVRHVGLQEEVDPEVYVPFTINPWGHMVLVIKTIPDPRVLVRTLQRAVLAVDPDIAVVGSSRSGGFISAEHYISRYLAVRRFSVLLLGGFAVCALVLAAVGIYGVISYNVAQRTREMGIRTALGAEARDVTALVVRQSMRRVLIGLGIGVAAAVALTRLMTALLYGVTATDPLTFMTVTLLLSLVALMASYMPARRASRVDPAAALRYE